MGEYEDRIRHDIRRKYGSIPKMASATGLAKNTIYHALERGMENTTTKTRYAILEPLYGPRAQYMFDEQDNDLSPNEQELLDIYRQVEPWERELILSHAKMVLVHAKPSDR